MHKDFKKLNQNVSPSNVPDVVSAFEDTKSPEVEKKVVSPAPTFPFYFTEGESESIFDLTRDIGEKLKHLFKGTTEMAPVGSLAAYFKEREEKEVVKPVDSA